MRRTLVRGLVVGMMVVGAHASRVGATVDMGGPWNVIVTSGFATGIQCGLDVTQTGSALTIAGDGCPVVGAFVLTGTIDSTSGAFAVSGFGGPPDGCAGGMTISGTTNASSTAFTGAFSCAGLSGSPLTGGLDGSRCGNGVLDAGEACDDGARTDGDCCSKTCTFEAAGTACVPSDGNECTLDVCDGAGTCTHPDSPSYGCTSDGNPCTDDVCGGGVCQHLANTRPCEDGNPCTRDDMCSGGTCNAGTCSLCCDAGAGCTPALATACKEPTLPTGPLQYRFDGLLPPLGLVKWKWKHGEAVALGELGDPVASTDYALCLYRHDGFGTLRLVMDAFAPAGGTCVGHPCWKALGTNGFKYADRAGSPDGITQLVLRAGVAGAAKVTVKGKGSNVSSNPVLGPLPVIAQVRGSNGTCFEAGYATATRDLVGSKGTLTFSDFLAKKSSPSGAFID